MLTACSSRPWFRRTFIALVMTLVAPGLFAQTGISQQATFSRPRNAQKYAPACVLVKFRTGRTEVAKTAIHSMMRATVRARYTTLKSLELVELPQDLSVPQAIQEYRKNPDVIYAEPDYYVYPSENAPNDTYFSLLWSMKNTGMSGGVPGADIGATKAWDLSTGSKDVAIATLDTGMVAMHPDLAPNAMPGRNYVGDLTVDDPWDFIGHGTHVAGTIGAVGNNNLGVAGVNWNVSMVPCKFIGWDGEPLRPRSRASTMSLA